MAEAGDKSIPDICEKKYNCSEGIGDLRHHFPTATPFQGREKVHEVDENVDNPSLYHLVPPGDHKTGKREYERGS